MNRRSKLFVKPSLQFRYLLLMVVGMIVPALIVGGFLYYFIFNSTAAQLGMPEAIATNLIPVMNRVNIMLGIGLLPFFIILFFLALVFSHRFCGPLERVERDLDRILKGDYSIRFRVRKSDDVGGIVERLNKLLEILQSKRG